MDWFVEARPSVKLPEYLCAVPCVWVCARACYCFKFAIRMRKRNDLFVINLKYTISPFGLGHKPNTTRRPKTIRPPCTDTHRTCEWGNCGWNRNSYLMVGGIEIVLPPIKSVFCIESVVVVLYEPELLSWYSCSAISVVGISISVSTSIFCVSFFFSEFVFDFGWS